MASRNSGVARSFAKQAWKSKPVSNISQRNFDVAVVGAGPAGICAAVRAAQSDASVALIDDNVAPGGQIWRSGVQPSRYAEAARWLELLSHARVRVISGARVFHAERDVLHVETNQSSFQIHADKLVLATGARELFLPFPGWTLPNVVGAGGLQALAKSGLPLSGKRIVVAGTGPLLLAAAAYFSEHGARVLCICEQASVTRIARFTSAMAAFLGKLGEAAALKYRCRRTPYLTNAWVVAALGQDRLQAVKILVRGRIQEIECDYLACGFHLVPNLELPKALACRMTSGFVEVNESQETSQRNVFCAGEPTGIGGVELSMLEGEIAGYAAAGRPEAARTLFAKRRRQQRLVPAMKTAFSLRPELARIALPDTLLCRCEDVSMEAVQKHGSWRLAKLHSRCGMGPCQGRVCGAAAEFLFGWSIDSWRPPIFPARCSSLAAMSSAANRLQTDGGMQ
jgi:D-hydroxyproline dehydrogenase subunit alpha